MMARLQKGRLRFRIPLISIMAILVDINTRILCQGIMRDFGSRHAKAFSRLWHKTRGRGHSRKGWAVL